ncbi:MAG: S-layer homology domain-containing protein [Chitinophagales bacterium]
MGRVLVFSLLAILSLAPAVQAFEVIPNEHWAASAVDQLHGEGVLIGYPDGTFKGAQPATRYELAIALKRLETLVQGLVAAKTASYTTAVAATNPAPLAPAPPVAPAPPAPAAPEPVDLGPLNQEIARLKDAATLLAEGQRVSLANDDRHDKALADLAATVANLEKSVKAGEVNLADLQKQLSAVNDRLAALERSVQGLQAADQNFLTAEKAKPLIQSETADLRDQLKKLQEENSALRAESAKQKDSLTRLYWILAGVGILAVAK